MKHILLFIILIGLVLGGVLAVVPCGAASTTEVVVESSAVWAEVMRTLSETGVETVAVTFTVEVPAGWSILGVASGVAAEGMILTNSPCGEGVQTVRLLLDGAPVLSPAGTPFLRLSLRGAENTIGEMTLTPSEGCLYYVDADGCVCTAPLPVSVVSLLYATDESDDVHTEPSEKPPSTETTREPGESKTDTDTGTETESGVSLPSDSFPSGEQTEAETTAPITPLPAPSTCIGYQLTPVWNGEYAVRFLFHAGDAPVPALVCFGGGSLTFVVERTQTITANTEEGVLVYTAEGGFLTYTYRHLSVARAYRFCMGGKEICMGDNPSQACKQNGSFE